MKLKMKELNILLYIAEFFEVRPHYSVFDAITRMKELQMKELQKEFGVFGEDAYYAVYKYLKAIND